MLKILKIHVFIFIQLQSLLPWKMVGLWLRVKVIVFKVNNVDVTRKNINRPRCGANDVS
jgi:hypothetical protein